MTNAWQTIRPTGFEIIKFQMKKLSHTFIFACLYAISAMFAIFGWCSISTTIFMFGIIAFNSLISLHRFETKCRESGISKSQG
jgi:hypothetical protein